LTELNRVKEIKGILNAMEKFGLTAGFIVSKDQDEQIEIAEKVIRVLNANRFIRKFGIYSEFLSFPYNYLVPK
jgi:hypothetical protein